MSIPKWKKYLPKLMGTAIVLGVGAGVVMMISAFMNSDDSAPKKKIQKITLLTPPPPPPPPPKIERPPEPEVKEEVDIPEPDQLEDLPEMADEPPAGDLGLDAEGGAGGDAFGLVGRKGGRGLLAGDPYMVYASQLQRQIEDALLEEKSVRKKAYTVVARIWVGSDGTIEQADLSRSSGNEKVDEKLVDLIRNLQALSDIPPAGMPQPIKLRITSRL